jgi:hypothetical protein
VRINFATVILHGPRRNGARQNLTVGPFGRALSWGCAVAFRLGRAGVGVGVGVRATSFQPWRSTDVLITDSDIRSQGRFGILSCMPACVNSHFDRDSGGRLPTITSNSVVQCFELIIRPYKHRNWNRFFLALADASPK